MQLVFGKPKMATFATNCLPAGAMSRRGTREAAYRGRYRVTGNHIDYVDDTGFTGDGDCRDGVLFHAGMVLRRRAV